MPQETKVRMVESGYFEKPNVIVDELAAPMPDATYKIYDLMIRKTYGWGQESDAISFSQIEAISGKSRPTVSKCCKELVESGLLEIVGKGAKDTNIYRVNVLTSKNIELAVNYFNQLKNLTVSSKNSLPEVVKKFNTQKKTPQKKLKETIHQGKAATPVPVGKFAMHMDWQPSETGLQGLKLMRVDLDDQESREIFVGFLSHWTEQGIAKGVERTQAEWEKALRNNFSTGALAQRKQAFASKHVQAAETEVDACWNAYSNAYAQRHGATPVRNSKTDMQLAKFIESIGADDAPAIAAHFLQTNNSYYITRYHDLALLVADCQKIRTEWLTGRQMTAAEARQADATQNRLSVYNEVARQIKAGEF